MTALFGPVTTLPQARVEEVFYAVMERSGWACECTGQCGDSHDGQDGNRCGRSRPAIVPHAAPKGVGLPAEEAERRLSADQFMTWCGQCSADASTQAEFARAEREQREPDFLNLRPTLAIHLCRKEA